MSTNDIPPSQSMQLQSFGDVRRFVLDTVVMLRDGTLSVDRGIAIAANLKVLNDNIQVEIDAAKLSMRAADKGQDFGSLVVMGRRMLIESSQR